MIEAFFSSLFRFQYMAISDDRQRIMPTSEDRNRSQALDYPEAVLLTNPANSLLRGEVLLHSFDKLC